MEEGREGTVGAEEIGQASSLCGPCTLRVGCTCGPCCVDPTWPLSSRNSHSKWEDLEQITCSWAITSVQIQGSVVGYKWGPPGVSWGSRGAAVGSSWDVEALVSALQLKSRGLSISPLLWARFSI